MQPGGWSVRAAVWNARAALLYSVGGWTLLGAMMHYSSQSAGPEQDGRENESQPQENQTPKQEIHTTDTILGFKMTTIVTYKEVQPPITRLLRSVVAFFVPGDGPSEN